MLRCLACKVSLAPEMSHVQSTDEEFCAFISESGRRHKNVTCSSSSSVSSHSLTPAPYSGHTRAPPDPLGSAVFDMSQNKASPTCPRTSYFPRRCFWTYVVFGVVGGVCYRRFIPRKLEVMLS
mmetsp:Transcript_13122/g.25224  ORF Transcript_13122/g.25224 Transcript_13122/m.25224 type:complete len:123 (-) Transcript_13122:338-706(-)